MPVARLLWRGGVARVGVRQDRGAVAAEEVMPAANPPNRPPNFVLWSVLAAVGLFAIGLAVCGLAGLCRTEYRLPPAQEALLLPLGWSWYAAAPGLVVGLVLRWWSRRRPPPC